jgi:hypothetical protein
MTQTGHWCAETTVRITFAVLVPWITAERAIAIMAVKDPETKGQTHPRGMTVILRRADLGQIGCDRPALCCTTKQATRCCR